LAELSDILVDDFDIVDVLTTLAERCAEVLDISAAGIMLIGPGGGLQVLSNSGQELCLRTLLALQSEDGPFADSFRAGVAVRDHPLTHGDDEHGDGGGAAAVPRHEVVDAVPMRLRHQVIGALNLIRDEGSSLSRDDLATAQILADLATIAVIQHNAGRRGATAVDDQLRQALEDRMVIEQAKGLVAERDGIDIDDAFTRIRERAHHDHYRLADIAHDIVDGTLLPAALDVTSSNPAASS
jgi:GAF domain-containing protein